VGINDKPEQDWRLLCESTPFTWKRIRYNSPTHCEARVSITAARVLRHHPHIRTNHWFLVVRDEIRNVGYFRRQPSTSPKESDETGTGGWRCRSLEAYSLRRRLLPSCPSIHPESINQVTASALHLFAPQPYHHSRGPAVARSFAMPATRLCKIQV